MRDNSHNQAAIVNCVLATLVSVVKVKVEGANLIQAALSLEARTPQLKNVAMELERLRSSSSTYLTMMALTLIASSIFYIKMSPRKRAIPIFSLVLSLVCLAITLLTQ